MGNIVAKFDIDKLFAGVYEAVDIITATVVDAMQMACLEVTQNDNFRRGDGGLRLGCGVQYDMFYADLTYDIGLANICHDTFDTSHNGGLQLNFGVNF